MSVKGCAFDGCGRAHYGNGLCNPHWQQQKKGRPLTAIREPRTGNCIYPGCDRVRASADYCQGHWKQLKRGEDLHELEPRQSQKGLQCFMPKCDREAEALGLCFQHRYVGRKFSLTREQVEALFTDPVCEICGAQNTGERGFHIDHDHACCPGDKSCGKCVRGLLCGRCNAGLGFFRDDTSFLQSAIEYLENRRVAA